MCRHVKLSRLKYGWYVVMTKLLVHLFVSSNHLSVSCFASNKKEKKKEKKTDKAKNNRQICSPLESPFGK